MTTKLLETLTLAEEALRLIIDGGDNEDDEMFYQGLTKGNEALATIREQKAKLEKQEPVNTKAIRAVIAADREKNNANNNS